MVRSRSILVLPKRSFNGTNMATEAVGRARAEDVKPAAAPKTFRTQFHVVGLKRDELRVVVPAWDRKPVSLKRSILPPSIQNVLAIDYIFYAHADLDASSPEELVTSMTDFETGGMLPKKELA